MQDLSTTYGKTIHTWQVDKGDPLPLGPPTLMMSFTADGKSVFQVENNNRPNKSKSC
jgi:hypothetical protein